MKHKISKRLPGLPVPLLLPLLFVWGSCSYDHGVDPILSRLKGTVIFEGGLPSYNDIREVRIVVAKKVPPENFTTDVIFSDPLPFSRAASRVADDTVRYEIAVDAGVYAITGILYRRQGRGWNIASLLGIYGIDLNRQEFNPRVIAVGQDAIVDHVDLRAYWELARQEATVEGEIKFKGRWREDTDFFLLGFFDYLPPPGAPAIPQAFQFILQRSPRASYSYSAPVSVDQQSQSRDYKFVALFWKGKTTRLDSIRAIGFYHCAKDSALPQPVKVSALGTAKNIDFAANFDKLPNGVIFRKDGAPCPP